MRKRDIRSAWEGEETTQSLWLILYWRAPDEAENRIFKFILKTAASTPVLTETIDSQLKSFKLY